MPPRILITRSRHQTSDLATGLRALGAEPILIPTIALAPPTTWAPLDEAIATLTTPDGPDWLLFTSANAVAAFHQRLGGSAPMSEAPEIGTTRSGEAPQMAGSHLRIAAIGPATARALTDIGLFPDLLPAQAVAESLAAALLPHVNPGRTRMLLLRAETARDLLPDTLTRAGALLTVIPAYRTVIPAGSIPQLQALFSTPATYPDAVTFTSSSTATNLFTLLEAAGLTLPPEILRASIGPITSQTLRDLGYPAHLESPESNIASLVETLASHFQLT